VQKVKTELVPKGTITSAKGFLAGAVSAGLKTKGEETADLGILFSEAPAVAAGMFTANKIKAAPLILCQRHLAKRSAQAIIVNSGYANACTGEQGTRDALEMANLTAKKLGISVQDVLVASTGVIGTHLPMEHIRAGVERVTPSAEGGHELAEAITTTDAAPKELAVTCNISGSEIIIGGIAKGAGMIHPNLATLLCFLATDAAVDPDFLQQALKKAVDVSFNMITIDGDTSPNDTVLLLANGLAGNEVIADGLPAEMFQGALDEICLYLARQVVKGGEGATKLIEVRIEGASSVAEARLAARAIAASPLVKTAVHGCDPNWGRIIAALGRSGSQVEEAKLDLFLADVCLMEKGKPTPFDRERAKAILGEDEVNIRLCLNLGDGEATAWGCDLSEEYVKINSEYTT
jgi:glutamate N-acetyltransferase/amino-acid N-acetyltransferase